MHETLLSSVFCDATKAHPACASLASALHWFIPETKDAQKLPSVTFTARDVVPLGCGNFYTGVLEVRLESQSDDETNSETHIARANLLLAALKDPDPATNLKGQINAALPRRVRIQGYAVVGGGRGVDGRKWTAAALIRVGFRTV